MKRFTAFTSLPHPPPPPPPYHTLLHLLLYTNEHKTCGGINAMRAEQLTGAELDYLQQKFTHPPTHPVHTLTQVCVVAPSRGCSRADTLIMKN